MKRRVAVLFGGRSAEHEISCISARSVIDALDPGRNEIITIGITREGEWRLMPGGPPVLAAGSERLPAISPESGAGVTLDRRPGASALVAEDGSRTGVDVVFPVLHGPHGEDGSVQGFLELAGVAYVGAGVLASALGMDKAAQKVLFAASGLPVVACETVHEREWKEDPEGIEARIEHLGCPVFVKPAALGSSVGVTKVKEPSALREGIGRAFRYGRKIVVEQGVEGAREIECAVLGNDEPVASVPGEIVPHGEFYDYRAKYLEEGSRLIIPAELSPAVTEEVQRTAVIAFQAIDCAGMARVDFFLRAETELLVNEINTIPGFTSISMYPKLWEASGVTYPELIERLVELAVERAEREQEKTTAPEEA